MTTANTAAIVLAAGLGTRMRSGLPKVLHPLAGRPMIGQLIESLEKLDPERIVVVVGRHMEAVAEAVAPHAVVVQEPPLGTGHAVLAAERLLKGFAGDVLVLFGADPLITVATLRQLLRARRAKTNPTVAVLGFRPRDPGRLGRLIVGADGGLETIVEWRDATPDQRKIKLCNAGAMAIDGRALFPLLRRVGKDNAKGEYYLTEIITLARAGGRACTVVEGDADELIGIDDRTDLARAEAIMQARLRAKALAGGATLVAPETVHLAFDTRLGRDVRVGPYVVFGPGVAVGEGTEIHSFCHVEGAIIGRDARIGPFARLRPGARIGDRAHVGNFVEAKNAVVEAGAKANHLAYLGDARVGAGANVGAGTITCNYDGFAKHRTEIGPGAFIGSNAALVAPVTIGAGAIVGAGSVITEDVPADALALERTPQKTIVGGGARVRALKKATGTAAGPDARRRAGT